MFKKFVMKKEDKIDARIKKTFAARDKKFQDDLKDKNEKKAEKDMKFKKNRLYD